VTIPSSDDSSAAAPLSDGAQLRSRPHVLHGFTYRAPTPVGTAFVTINSDAEGDVREVFVTVGRAGSDVAADAEALGRLISLACRIPTSLTPHQVVEAVIDQLAGIGGSSSLGYGPKRVRSLADGVAQVLSEHGRISHKIGRVDQASDVDDRQDAEGIGEVDLVQKMDSRHSGDFCPSCSQMTLVNEEGCKKCYNCGFSSC
jgi:ribonucleoside-diphosphate reductase alpha chain